MPVRSGPCGGITQFARPEYTRPGADRYYPADSCGGGVQMISDETRYELIRLLEANPEMSQRDVARELGISLGKTNYCLRALIQRGLIKAANFKNSQNRTAYMYLLTPRGIEDKAKLTLRFLQIKMREYETLRVEIKQLQREVEGRDPQ